MIKIKAARARPHDHLRTLPRFNRPARAYGLGCVEDLAGILIVLIILASAIVAGYEAIDRLVHPRPITQLGWLMAAGIAGFIGNEVVAVFRIRVGRQMNSAALIADGYHARTDGLTWERSRLWTPRQARGCVLYCSKRCRASGRASRSPEAAAPWSC